MAVVLLGAAALAACGQSTHRAASSTTRPAAHRTTTTSQPTAPPTKTPAAQQWPTYHYDNARSGNAPGQPPASSLSQRWVASLDGQVYAEPLVDGDQVIVATENNTVYSLQASTSAVMWSAPLGTPMAGSALPCGNIDPSGITGTPVLDPADGVVWVVAYVEPGVHELVSLELATGAVRSRQTIELPGVDGLAQQQRSALTLTAGHVYIPFGGLYGDCGNYRGFVVSFPTSGTGAQATFTVQTARQGAIWAPPGAVVGPGGNLFVATGNGAPSTTFDQGDAVIELTPALSVVATFAPDNWQQLDQDDLDLGSTSPTLVGGQLFQVGKQGVGYLLDPADLGGVGGQKYSAPVCSGPAFGATAVDGSTVFVPCRSGLVALRFGPGPTFTTAWTQPAIVPGSPVVAGGAVWVVSHQGMLDEVDEQTGAIVASQVVGIGATSFPSLAVAGGNLYVPAGNMVVSFAGA